MLSALVGVSLQQRTSTVGIKDNAVLKTKWRSHQRQRPRPRVRVSKADPVQEVGKGRGLDMRRGELVSHGKRANFERDHCRGGEMHDGGKDDSEDGYGEGSGSSRGGCGGRKRQAVEKPDNGTASMGVVAPAAAGAAEDVVQGCVTPVLGARETAAPAVVKPLVLSQPTACKRPCLVCAYKDVSDGHGGSQGVRRHLALHFPSTSHLRLDAGASFEEPAPLPQPCSFTKRNLWTWAVVADWMVGVGTAENMEFPTLALSIGIMHRAVCAAPALWNEEYLQLLGACCLLLASKTNDRVPLTFAMIMESCGFCFRLEDAVALEQCIVTVLKAHLCAPTAFTFFTSLISLAPWELRTDDLLWTSTDPPDVLVKRVLPSPSAFPEQWEALVMHYMERPYTDVRFMTAFSPLVRTVAAMQLASAVLEAQVPSLRLCACERKQRSTTAGCARHALHRARLEASWCALVPCDSDLTACGAWLFAIIVNAAQKMATYCHMVRARKEAIAARGNVTDTPLEPLPKPEPRPYLDTKRLQHDRFASIATAGIRLPSTQPVLGRGRVEALISAGGFAYTDVYGFAAASTFAACRCGDGGDAGGAGGLTESHAASLRRSAVTGGSPAVPCLSRDKCDVDTSAASSDGVKASGKMVAVVAVAAAAVTAHELSDTEKVK